MANWCNNFVSFRGTEANILKLKQALEAAIDLQENNGVGIGNLTPRDWFFNMMISDSTAVDIQFFYNTKWSPNLDDLADVCREYGVIAELDYQEDGMDIRGSAVFSKDGSYIDMPMEQEFLDLVTYSIERDIYTYTPTGDQSDCRDDLIEEWYPKWKAHQAKGIMAQVTEADFFNTADKLTEQGIKNMFDIVKGGSDENN
jgi:hypothetical protein